MTCQVVTVDRNHFFARTRGNASDDGEKHQKDWERLHNVTCKVSHGKYVDFAGEGSLSLERMLVVTDV